MIPRKINGQRIFASSSWKEIMENVKKFWDEDMFITEFKYGNGAYFVVMSNVKGWKGQVIRSGSSFPGEKVSEMWNENYYITNVLWDGDDWVVVMTGVDYCSTQSYFTRTKWAEFREKISDGWKEDKIVTNLCCEKQSSYNNYFAVMTKFKDGSPSQSRRYIEGRLTIQELEGMCEGGKYLVDIYDFDGGVYVVTAGSTGWDSCKVCKSRDLRSLSEKISSYWGRGYYVTSLACYGEEWFVVLGHE